MVTVSLQNSYYYHTLAWLPILIDLHFSDRFRTAINVFGDSIGCAIVQHLSRKELQTLDDQKRISIDTNNPNTIVSHLIPNNIITYPPNHVIPVPYDNPMFINSPRTVFDEEENSTIRKTYF